MEKLKSLSKLQLNTIVNETRVRLDSSQGVKAGRACPNPRTGRLSGTFQNGVHDSGEVLRVPIVAWVGRGLLALAPAVSKALLL